MSVALHRSLQGYYRRGLARAQMKGVAWAEGGRKQRS